MTLRYAHLSQQHVREEMAKTESAAQRIAQSPAQAKAESVTI
jgi:hypothetical protein